MTRLSKLIVGCVAVAALLVPMAALAQTTPSGIAGIVRNAQGQPVANVKVQAESPALIEKVREAVTDGRGEYKLENLTTGTYVVTFSAAGFQTLKNENLVLPAAFTANLSVALTAGRPEQVITVAAVVSSVDTQSATAEKVISREQLENLPTGGGAGVQTASALTPGLKTTELTDVGGGEAAQAQRTNTVSYHGKTGIRVQFDGLRSQNYCAGGYPAYVVNTNMVAETSVQTGGMSAEYASTGAAVNMIPKSGSNVWKVTISGLGTSDGAGLIGNNLTDELEKKGLTSTSKAIYKFDIGSAWGGPVSKDKIWIFQSNRYNGSKTQWAGVFYNAIQGSPKPYVDDPSRPAYRKEWTVSPAATRLTWQLTPRSKLNLYADLQRACTCQGETVGGTGPESVGGFSLWPTGGFMGTWSMPVNSKLLLEAGASAFLFHYPNWMPPEVSALVNAQNPYGPVSILDNISKYRWNNLGGSTNNDDINYTDRFGQRFSATYVTGAHAIKLGVTNDYGRNWNNTRPWGVNKDGVSYVYNRGATDPISALKPAQIVQYAQPYYVKLNAMELGLFVQDKWTLDRLTLNYGIRYDNFRGYTSDQHANQGPFAYSLPARDYVSVNEIPNWKDLTPRVGASYDLFGNGKTAVKFSFAKYLNLTGSGFTSANNPITTSVTSVTRTWNDTLAVAGGTPGDFYPQCDYTITTANGECGAISDVNFGKNNPKATTFEDAVRTGFGSRVRFYEWGAEVQHQFRPGFSVSAGYFHNWSSGFLVTDNTQVDPIDYKAYCITSPVDPRLPGGGGQKVCGMSDLNPAKNGLITNVVKKADGFVGGASGVNCGYQTPGNATDVAAIGYDVCGKNDFFSMGIALRLAKGIRIGGGIDMGRTEKNSCFTVDNPQQASLYCDQVYPWIDQFEMKLNFTYPLPVPGQITMTAAYQDNPGPVIKAIYSVTSLQTDLGRQLGACGTRTAAACTSTADVPLIAPYSQFEARRRQLDLRFAKNIQMGKTRLNASVGLYNIFNNSSVIRAIDAYGTDWQKPTAVLSARMIQFQGSLNF